VTKHDGVRRRRHRQGERIGADDACKQWFNNLQSRTGENFCYLYVFPSSRWD
jgi:hypothetical protein